MFLDGAYSSLHHNGRRWYEVITAHVINEISLVSETISIVETEGNKMGSGVFQLTF